MKKCMEKHINELLNVTNSVKKQKIIRKKLNNNNTIKNINLLLIQGLHNL